MLPHFKRQLCEFVERNIPDFHCRRLESLKRLKLKDILRRKNPYLFRAKNTFTAEELVRSILDAYLSSQEETLFGAFLERVAIFICQCCFNGKKSAAEGIDLEFMRDDVLYIVSIMSGPNWGNSSQLKKLQDNFRKAKKILGANTMGRSIVAVNGCCYGRDNKEDKGDYLKLCGENFWSFISGEASLYLDIIEPLGHTAKECNENFHREFVKVVNQFTREFLEEFCLITGEIDWERLVRFNSCAAYP
ncbi:conserved cytoplasmic hypothetical protein [Candidatus Glomeribacter gigasporarum BEG34]|uniref:Type II restriction endonuclease EcoO109IR domain-containing protein n=1 Tax=Candidatus Glomeribacter gigasporarum BEG34 TaxID=1070319 RepID=G2JAV1_9BURK|nr:PmeII family type II restriction endonuclease [Candidatus Glomeribacter gigasporarum]CCD29903.1 conserved cytoplasmic hypothetical protein [Candidatus Glomeribacter gigasporarum BEG34]